MIDLSAIESEERVLGFLLNVLYPDEKKNSTLALLTKDHFTYHKHKILYEAISKYKIFDKIVLWEKIKSTSPEMDWKDLEDIYDYISHQEAESYTKVLQDKYQKRQLYEFGKYIQNAVMDGEDEVELALQAQKVLSSMSSKIKVDTNQELLEKVLSEEKVNVISTGFKHLDEYLGGYSRGMIITIAGDSGHMKTTFAIEKAFRMAQRNPNLKIGIFSKEMLAEDLMKKQISRICKIPISKIFAHDYDKELVRQKMDEVEEFRNNRIQIINPNLFTGVADIAKIQMTYKYDIWFLDFIQLLEFSKHASNSSDYNVQVGQNMRNLQSLALATKSVGIILSQVKKGVEYRDVRKPTISDIEWSGLIKQLSTYIFFSYYPSKYYGGKISEDNYYLLGEKTRFAGSFTYPIKVLPDLGLFEEIESAEERTKKVSNLIGLTSK